MAIPQTELHEFLEFKYMQYNQPSFIANDPVSIPHLFKKKQDIEIAGFLAATISWGNRKSIVANARRLVSMMDDDPYNFIMHASHKELLAFEGFVHRTFNGEDCIFFLSSLISIYSGNESMEDLFLSLGKEGPQHAISAFRERFLSLPHPKHVEKHISGSPYGLIGEKDQHVPAMDGPPGRAGVDFGIWRRISPSDLVCPLDKGFGNQEGRRIAVANSRNAPRLHGPRLHPERRSAPPPPVRYLSIPKRKALNSSLMGDSLRIVAQHECDRLDGRVVQKVASERWPKVLSRCFVLGRLRPLSALSRTPSIRRRSASWQSPAGGTAACTRRSSPASSHRQTVR